MNSDDAVLQKALRHRDASEVMYKALTKIAEHLDADNANSYRADDPEGAMDTCYALAKDALAKTE